MISRPRGNPVGANKNIFAKTWQRMSNNYFENWLKVIKSFISLPCPNIISM